MATYTPNSDIQTTDWSRQIPGQNYYENVAAANTGYVFTESEDTPIIFGFANQGDIYNFPNHSAYINCQVEPGSSSTGTVNMSLLQSDEVFFNSSWVVTDSNQNFYPTFSSSNLDDVTLSISFSDLSANTWGAVSILNLQTREAPYNVGNESRQESLMTMLQFDTRLSEEEMLRKYLYDPRSYAGYKSEAQMYAEIHGYSLGVKPKNLAPDSTIGDIISITGLDIGDFTLYDKGQRTMQYHLAEVLNNRRTGNQFTGNFTLNTFFERLPLDRDFTGLNTNLGEQAIYSGTENSAWTTGAGGEDGGGFTLEDGQTLQVPVNTPQESGGFETYIVETKPGFSASGGGSDQTLFEISAYVRCDYIVEVSGFRANVWDTVAGDYTAMVDCSGSWTDAEAVKVALSLDHDEGDITVKLDLNDGEMNSQETESTINLGSGGDTLFLGSGVS